MLPPSGYVLVNSLVGLHVLYDDVWNAINNALPLALGKMGTYVSTFSPVVDQIADQKRTKLILDGVQAALFVVLGPTFHSGMFCCPRECCLTHVLTVNDRFR